MRPDPLPTLPSSLRQGSGANLLNNSDLIQGIRNKLSGAGSQNQNSPNYPSGPSFLNDSALLSGIAASIKKNTNTDTATNFMNDRGLLEGIAANIRESQGGFRRSDSFNAVGSKPRDTRLTEK